jgi:hypothetical protein
MASVEWSQQTVKNFRKIFDDWLSCIFRGFSKKRQPSGHTKPKRFDMPPGARKTLAHAERENVKVSSKAKLSSQWPMDINFRLRQR